MKLSSLKKEKLYLWATKKYLADDTLAERLRR